MKTVLIFLAVCIVGYWLYEFYQQNPDDLPSMHHQKLTTTPIPSEPPPDDRGPPPNLVAIPVRGGSTLTNAKVKEARADSVLFLCDQGIFDITYDRLTPDFRKYYAPAPTPSPSVDPTPQSTAPVVIKPYMPEPQRTAEEEVNLRVSFLQREAALRQHLKDDQEIMTRWYKQSSFDPGAMSQTTFDSTKADFDATTAQLNQLEATGP
jgi:hypothetical protein